MIESIIEIYNGLSFIEIMLMLIFLQLLMLNIKSILKAYIDKRESNMTYEQKKNRDLWLR